MLDGSSSTGVSERYQTRFEQEISPRLSIRLPIIITHL